MKKLIPVAFIIFAALIWLTWKPSDQPSLAPQPETTQEKQTNSVAPEEEQTFMRPGDHLLAEFGTSNSSPTEDVRKLGYTLEGFFNIHKTIDSFHASTNSDFYKLLSGKNPDGEAFVSPGHSIYGKSGLLVDRFGTPFFFHPLAKPKVEVRSAGPDRKMFTADDIHRTPEGVILPAADANSSSLFPPPGQRE